MKKLFALLALVTVTSPVFAQFGDLGKKLPSIPGVESIFKKGPAITTSLKDAKWEAADQDGINPDSKPLSSLKKPMNLIMMNCGTSRLLCLWGRLD